jgi:hypothetical protein
MESKNGKTKQRINKKTKAISKFSFFKKTIFLFIFIFQQEILDYAMKSIEKVLKHLLYCILD